MVASPHSKKEEMQRQGGTVDGYGKFSLLLDSSIINMETKDHCLKILEMVSKILAGKIG